MKHTKWFSAIWLSLLLVFALTPAFADSSSGGFSISDKFDEIWTEIQKQYVEPIPDTPEAKNDCASKILSGGVAACLNDPHSSYLDAEAMAEMRVDMSGKFGGVGLELTANRNAAMVVSPIDGTPAGDSGKFRTGDIIVEVDGERVDQKGLVYIVKKIRGAPDTQVIIRVRREGRLLEPVTLVRKDIQIQSVASEAIEPGIFYVKIRQFQEETWRQFGEAVVKHAQEAMGAGLEPRFVFDLRGNPGGLLSSVEVIAALFADSPTDIIVTTRSRSGDEITRVSDLRFRLAGYFRDFKFVVLVDQGSASASEIFAAFIKDLGKAKVIGKNTFGKGSVQTIISLKGGTGLRLTTNEYLVGNGRVKVNGVGVQADVEVEDSRTPRSSADDIAAGRKPRLADPASDNQLKKGLEVLGPASQYPAPQKEPTSIPVPDLL